MRSGQLLRPICALPAEALPQLFLLANSLENKREFVCWKAAVRNLSRKRKLWRPAKISVNPIFLLIPHGPGSLAVPAPAGIYQSEKSASACGFGRSIQLISRNETGFR